MPQKEHVPIREPRRCSEPDCEEPIHGRGLCMRHYRRARDRAIASGSWVPGPSGNFGDPEGHRISAKMGGAVRAQDPESLAAAGRIGHQRLIEREPDAHQRLARQGSAATDRDPERMRALQLKSQEAYRANRQREAKSEDGSEPSA